MYNMNDIVTADEDTKRYLDFQTTQGKFVLDLIQQGKVPSFPQIFASSKTAKLSDDEKDNKGIVQFSFIVKSSDGKVMPLKRTKDDHNITRGGSIMISWSPFASIYSGGAGYFPMSEMDLLDIYHWEVVHKDTLPEPNIIPLGFIVNNKQSKKYLFYVFVAQYDLLAEELNNAFGLRKDKDDMRPFQLPEELLPTREKCLEGSRADFVNPANKADLQALRMLLVQNESDNFILDQSQAYPIEKTQGKRLPTVLYGGANVYISYPASGREIALELAKRLTLSGYQVYVPKYEAGQNESPLLYSRATIFVCQPETSTDRNVVNDVNIINEICEEQLRCSTYMTMKVLFQEGKNRHSVSPQGFEDHPLCDAFIQHEGEEQMDIDGRWSRLLNEIQRNILPDPNIPD